MDSEMDTQNIINIVAAVAIGSGGWFARELWGAVKDLRQTVHDIEVDLPKSYVSKADIETMFQRIYDKLDGKADK